MNAFDLCRIAKRNRFLTTESLNIKDAFKKISTNKKKIIVVFGSLYLVGNVLSKN